MVNCPPSGTRQVRRQLSDPGPDGHATVRAGRRTEAAGPAGCATAHEGGSGGGDGQAPEVGIRGRQGRPQHLGQSHREVLCDRFGVSPAAPSRSIEVAPASGIPQGVTWGSEPGRGRW